MAWPAPRGRYGSSDCARRCATAGAAAAPRPWGTVGPGARPKCPGAPWGKGGTCKVQLWPFTSYKWLFLWDYTFYKCGYKML
jgi:hypothetical protein